MPLTNSQYNTLMRIYENKRLESRDHLISHYETIYKEVPKIKEIDDAISTNSVEQAKKLLNGDSKALDDLRIQLRTLSQQKKDLLQQAGFPADYLEPVYECPDCQDTGYVNNKKCHCFQKAAIDLFYTQSNLRGILEKENFDNFSFEYYSPNYIDRLSGESAKTLGQRAYNQCVTFVKNFDQIHTNLLLFGTTGIGKTFLTHCIAREIMQSVHSVLYLTACEFFDALLDKAVNRSEESLYLYEQIQNCDLLIIDDLGTERNTDFVISQLFICLNDRILNKKSTIISTNLTLEEIKSIYTDRIFSRIFDNFKILRLAGDDIRIQKKLKNREGK